MSSAHSMACVPSGVSKVTVYRARTAPRAIFAEVFLRAATRTGARTAAAEETVNADMFLRFESVCAAVDDGRGRREGVEARSSRFYTVVINGLHSWYVYVLHVPCVRCVSDGCVRERENRSFGSMCGVVMVEMI